MIGFCYAFLDFSCHNVTQIREFTHPNFVTNLMNFSELYNVESDHGAALTHTE